MSTQPQNHPDFSHEEDNAFLQSLYAKYYHPVSCMALGYLRNAEDAADVTSETFLALMKLLPTVRQLQGENVTHYLHGIARHLVLTRLRRRKTEDQAYRRMAELVHTHEQLNAGAQYLTCCALYDVQRALSQLSPGDAEVLRLHIFNQLSCSEIGARLSIQDASARRRLNRARKRLRMVMDSAPPEPAENRSRKRAK